MSSPTIQANPRSLIESMARNMPASAQDDTRQLLTLLLQNVTALAPGGNLLTIGGTQKNAAATPSGVSFQVAGQNGTYTVTITDPSTAKPGTIWHEISYSPLVSFTQNVTTLDATTATSVTVAAPGATNYFRLRVSYDRVNWSGYQVLSTTPVQAGLVQASSMAPAAAYNQTNFATVNSQAAGSAAIVTVSGTGGALTAYAAVKGANQTLQPSATVVGVTPGSNQFVGQDGTTGLYELRPTLASVLTDNLTPVGKVSVVSTAVPRLPTIVPIVQSGGVLGFDVTDGGAGASEPYTLAFGNYGPGSGATFGVQTIQNGVLLSVAPGNAGRNYPDTTTVLASGGQGGGVAGGGTASGGNGGRLSNV
jgi:hypothetical protein